MTFQINVAPSGHTFPCDIDDTVLAAGLHAGIGLPYGCKNGACGSCKGKVLSGSFEQKPHQARALSEAEKADGFALFCCVVPRSDLQIAVRGFGWVWMLGVWQTGEAARAEFGGAGIQQQPLRAFGIPRHNDSVIEFPTE